MSERLLSAKDWDRIGRALASGQELSLSRKDLRTGYTVTASVETVNNRTAAVIGQAAVLTVARDFGGWTSSQNFYTIKEAQKMLYG